MFRLLGVLATFVSAMYLTPTARAAAIGVAADVRVGSLITNPQAVTGPWEQLISGKVVGLDIEVRTATQGLPKSLPDTAQRVDYIWITTYVRTAGRSQRTFWSSHVPAQFGWQNNQLALDVPSDSAHGVQSVNLALTFDRNKSEWRGRFQNEWYAGPVVLKRPYAPHIGYRIIGDWLSGDSSGYACKHVALGADSALVIWSDIIDLPGNVIYPKGTTPPDSAPEWYGELDMDAELKYIGTNMLFFTGTDMSGDVVLGSVNQQGDVFSGESAHFGNGLTNGKFNPFVWRRTTPDCRT
jgi:hypothetical protein